MAAGYLSDSWTDLAQDAPNSRASLNAIKRTGYLGESPLRFPIWDNIKGFLARVYTGKVPSIPG
jgi:hypothetical protein